MNLDLNNIENMLRKNAKTIGKFYGFAAPMAAIKPEDPLGAIFENLEQAFNALLSGKLPKPDNVLTAMKHPNNKAILKNLAIAYIAGELGGGFIGAGNAKALKTAAVEAFKWNILGNAVLTWDWNPHPPAKFGGSGSSGGNSPSWGYKA